jgi:glucosamine--fructose-6-phosphate aminotransferase (isomerizing)
MSTDATSILASEILEQPRVVAHLLATERDRARRVTDALRQLRITHVLIAARGTSDNAARYGQYVLGARNGLPVGLTTPSLFGVYGRPPRLEDALVIGISQSGQSPDIVAVLAEARRQGVPTLALTNDPASPLAQAAEHNLYLQAGPERSVAATKTYTAQLTALALLSAAWAETSEDDLAALPDALTQVLSQAATPAKVAAQRLAATHSTRCVVLGRGYNFATAFEVALKMKELAYIAAEPYSSADFQHGPIAMIEAGFPAVVIAAGVTMRDEMNALVEQLRTLGATVALITDAPAATDDIPVSATVAEHLSPIPTVVAGQWLAYHLTRACGGDPDRPRTIRKITKTT